MGGRTRPPYPAAFRQQMVALVHAGRTPEELAEEFEPSAESIRVWVKRSDWGGGGTQEVPVPVGSGTLNPAEREELLRLRREVRQLKLEREILAKAAAWFARETNSVPFSSL
jgi:transposase